MKIKDRVKVATDEPRQLFSINTVGHITAIESGEYGVDFINGYSWYKENELDVIPSTGLTLKDEVIVRSNIDEPEVGERFQINTRGIVEEVDYQSVNDTPYRIRPYDGYGSHEWYSEIDLILIRRGR